MGVYRIEERSILGAITHLVVPAILVYLPEDQYHYPLYDDYARITLQYPHSSTQPIIPGPEFAV